MKSPLLDDFRWLVSSEASPHLERAVCESHDLVQLARRLRQGLSPERVHLVLEQAELRRRARSKFSRASQMFLTRTLLEQATEERLADYKAGRFPADRTVTDLCCGLGGDTIGFGKRGPTHAFDHDPVAALLVAANNVVYGNDPVTTTAADIRGLELDSGSHWHIDPDRRPMGLRTTIAEYFDPPVEFLEQLWRQAPHGAVKLAPATVVPGPWSAQAELEWLGSRRECRQQVAWFGDLAASPAVHRATVIDGCGNATSIAGIPDLAVDTGNHLGRFVLEPHAAALAARLTGCLAQRYQLLGIAPGVAYLTGDVSPSTPLLAAFEVIEVLPLDLRRLREALRLRHIGRLEVKVRGLDIVPDEMRKKLKLRGDDELTLLITGPPSHVRAILAKRCPESVLTATPRARIYNPSDA